MILKLRIQTDYLNMRKTKHNRKMNILAFLFFCG